MDIFHIHNGGGSFKSIGSPRLTIEKKFAALPDSAAGEAEGGAALTTSGGPTVKPTSLSTPVWRNSPIMMRPEGDGQQRRWWWLLASVGRFRSRVRPGGAATDGGGGKLVLAFAPRRDLAAPS